VPVSRGAPTGSAAQDVSQEAVELAAAGAPLKAAEVAVPAAAAAAAAAAEERADRSERAWALMTLLGVLYIGARGRAPVLQCAAC
jgi:hypothetical protein